MSAIPGYGRVGAGDQDFAGHTIRLEQAAPSARLGNLPS